MHDARKNTRETVRNALVKAGIQLHLNERQSWESTRRPGDQPGPHVLGFPYHEGGRSLVFVWGSHEQQPAGIIDLYFDKEKEEWNLRMVEHWAIRERWWVLEALKEAGATVEGGKFAPFPTAALPAVLRVIIRLYKHHERLSKMALQGPRRGNRKKS